MAEESSPPATPNIISAHSTPDRAPCNSLAAKGSIVWLDGQQDEHVSAASGNSLYNVHSTQWTHKVRHCRMSGHISICFRCASSINVYSLNWEGPSSSAGWHDGAWSPIMAVHVRRTCRQSRVVPLGSAHLSSASAVVCLGSLKITLLGLLYFDSASLYLIPSCA